MTQPISRMKVLTYKESPPMAISQELLDILVCPKCKGGIYLNESKDGLICENCRLVYEIRDDIPVMLIDEAKPLEH
ncbi:MAG: Trm112 family protein [Desulfobacterales bacterium]